MNINQNTSLNLSADGIPPRLYMAQGDSNTRTIIATLWDGAQSYKIPTDAVVMMRFRKPDGTGGIYDTTEGGKSITFSGNNVNIPVATQMLAIEGSVFAALDIYGTGTGKMAEKLSTFLLIIEVTKNVYSDAQIISSDYYNILTTQIAAAIEAGAKSDEAIKAAETAQTAATTAVNAKTAADNAKTPAVNSAKSATEANTAAQTAKSGAEAAKTAAQTAKSGAEAAKEQAQTAATGAANSAEAADDSAEDAEAWAVGKRNGVDVSSSDPAYHNNSRYYKDQAQTIAGGEYVSYGAAQGLTDSQKARARDNINAPAPYKAGDNISINNGAISTKTFPCNPNLAVNWYFGRPVNQRGQTSYTDSGYTIDRWKFGGYSQTITLATNGIIWDTNTGVWWGQTIENWDALVGKTATVSALIGGNLYSVSGVVNNSDRISVVVSEKVTLEISPEQKGVRLVTYVTESTSVGAVLAIKLELGSQQTLAHQENGVWVLNEIPKFGDQLAECQRYFEWVDVQLTTSFNGSTPYKVVKRTTPVFNYYSVIGTVGKISQYNSINNAWDDVEPSLPPTDLNLRSLVLYVPNQIPTRFRIAVSADL